MILAARLLALASTTLAIGLLTAPAYAEPTPDVAFACPKPIPAAYKKVSHAVTVVNGLHVDLYAWRDAHCQVRTVALQQEGHGNKGHGGYAIQMTYMVPGAHGPSRVTVNADNEAGDGGFGYFVSHERYRNFTNGDQNPIAEEIFGVDDSPLGRDFPVVSKVLTPTANSAAHRFTQTYHHYGTITPDPDDGQGNDVNNLPLNKSAYKNYPIPVSITWVFQAFTDFPRIDTVVSFAGIPGPDRVSFDVRGPYGVMVYDNKANGLVTGTMWGDRYQFDILNSPPTRESRWVWQTPNKGSRFNAQIAGAYEMGLVEPVPFSKSATRDPYADERGNISDIYNDGHGCESEQYELLPCDFWWPYQTIEFSLPGPGPVDSNQPTNFKKIAWGSSPFYGVGPSLPAVSDSPTTSENFNGFPASKKLAYSLCIVLGKTISGGLTKSVALAANKRCATTKFP